MITNKQTFRQMKTEAKRMVAHETKEKKDKVLNTLCSAQRRGNFLTSVVARKRVHHRLIAYLH